MPLNILGGLLAVLAAMILYTIGTWTAFRAKAFSRRTLTFLWVGVVFDFLATFLMGLSIGGLDLRPGLPFVHTTLALVAMFGMMIGTAVAAWAVTSKRDALVVTMSRVLLAPWALWAAVFAFGMVAQRR
jgi:hypothetical protein